MREILFRGKRTVNGDWVEGNLFIPDLPNTATQILIGTNIYRIPYDVIPSTVGQYTGLTDKYGKKIFEGDIVKIKGKTRYIFYGCSSFRHTNYGEYAAELTNVNTDRDCEVIGNIHDNPELLKGAEQ